MYIPALSQLEPWQLWWLRNARCNFKATISVGYYNWISKLDLRDTHIKNIMANDEDMNALLESLEKLLKFSTENWNKTTWLQQWRMIWGFPWRRLAEVPSQPKGQGKVLSRLSGHLSNKMGYICKDSAKFRRCALLPGCHDHSRGHAKRNSSHSTNPSEADCIATYSFKYNTSFSIPSRKILSTCCDATSHLGC